MTPPEQLARADVDRLLVAAGWAVQDVAAANLHERYATWAAQSDPASGRGPDGRWRVYGIDELLARDKASLDIFWLRDETLADSDNLPPPEVIAQEIVDDLEAALEQFRLIAADLNGGAGEPT